MIKWSLHNIQNTVSTGEINKRLHYEFVQVLSTVTHSERIHSSLLINRDFEFKELEGPSRYLLPSFGS